MTEDKEKKYCQESIVAYGTSMTIKATISGFIDVIDKFQKELPFFDAAIKANKVRLVIAYKDCVTEQTATAMIGEPDLLVEDLEKLRSKVLSDTKE